MSFSPTAIGAILPEVESLSGERPVSDAAPFTVVFAIYPGVTQLDFTGPFEVLSRVPGIRTVIASAAGGVVEAEQGLAFANTVRLADVERCDLILLPGGSGQTAVMGDAGFLGDVRRLAEGARYVGSVCTGSLILGAAGLLRGRRAASHWAFRELLRLFGAQPVADRVVRDGNVFTGGGITAGIDFALTVVAELFGDETARRIQLALEYAPAPPFDAGRPETAPAATVEAVAAMFAQSFPQREAAIRATAG
jgi:transcriptional regulator GlxA family with amidase domain